MAFTKTVFRALACAAVLGCAAALPQMPETFVISDDPLDLSNELPSDYRNWASVLSQVLLKKEGSDEKAASALERLMLATHGHLSKVADGEELLPRFHLQDPVLAAGDPVTVPPLAATAFASSATFFNYAPCVISESETGIAGVLQGINFNPILFNFAPTGLTAFAQGINFTPQLIYVNPLGGNIQPQGFNVQPGLIYVGPIGGNVQPQGANFQPIGIQVAPVGGNVQPQGAVVAPVGTAITPTDTLYNPRGVSIGAVDNDLTVAPADDAGPGL